jgi:hypothetical protein
VGNGGAWRILWGPGLIMMRVSDQKCSVNEKLMDFSEADSCHFFGPGRGVQVE